MTPSPSAARPPGAARRAGGPRSSRPLSWPLSPASAVAVLGLTLLLFAQQLAAQSTAQPGTQLNCGPGLSTPGETIPKGDIILHEGDQLELYCVLNLTHSFTKGRNASHLRFYRNDMSVGPEYQRVVNETTLKLTMHPNVSLAMYYCKLDPWKTAQEEVVCLNSVAVGYPPLDVSDFSCVSQNWQNLTCSWKKRPNPVKTRYSIWYRLPGRAGGRTKYACPDDSDSEKDTCKWAENSDPPYRLPYETFSFMIEGVNNLSNATYIHKFNHYANVIPSKVDKLKAKDKTAYSAYLEWYLPYPMQHFPAGIIHRVEYQPLWESRKSWHRVDTEKIEKIEKDKLSLNITSLKYANTVYDIRVYLRSAKANPQDDKLWSAPGAVTVKTLPDLPGAPPRTDIGSFEVLNHRSSRDVYLYWQTIPEYLQNGDGFGYKVMDAEDAGDVSQKWTLSELTKKYAKLTNVERNKSLRFRIASINKLGQSVNSSEIIIPEQRLIPSGPLQVTKVFYESGTYEVSWMPPAINMEEVHSYTIFWCDSIYDNMCSGYLNWTYVPGNITSKNMTVEDDKSYQFAVSANTFNASSGIVWASCTILHNKPIQKMKNFWVKRVGSTFMELGWSLDCLDRKQYVVGFRVYYCPALHKGTECKSPSQNITVGNTSQSAANLTGLRPYTTYSISIAVLSKGGESLPSDPLLNVTLEAAPSPPQNVSIVNITNTTITVAWNVPEEKNGVITKYEVHYDGKVLTKNNDNQKRQELVLENLTSYYNYSISVAACTFVCSDLSPPLLGETKIGEPGIVNAPKVVFQNKSMLLVTWDHPARPSGLLDYYEVNITHPGSNSSVEIRETYNTSLQMHMDGCSEAYAFSVRAVNVDPNNPQMKYRGKWSIPGEGKCYSGDLPSSLKIIIYVLTISVGILMSCMMIKLGHNLWAKCMDRKDVVPTFPPGILNNTKPSQEDEDFTMHQWGKHIHDNKPPQGFFPAADEERLLQQKDGHQRDRNLSGDSSGCSSGHESVSSSVTSGTHISSDSGTEVDRNEPGCRDPSWEATSDTGSNGGGGDPRQGQVAKCPIWDDVPYACVGGNGKGAVGVSTVRSTPNLTELAPGYTVLTSWPSSASISDKKLPQLPQTCGYVPLDTAQALPMPAAMVPVAAAEQAKHAAGQSNGYVAHPPTSLMWTPQPARPATTTSKGYVKTGTGSATPPTAATAKEAFTPECEGSWEEPFHRLGQQQQQQAGGYVKAGECVAIRPSRTEPALSTNAGGYVAAADPALLRSKAPAAAPPAAGTLKQAQAQAQQAPHEYVLTGQREAPRSAPLVVLDPVPPKAYCRVSERDRDSVARPVPKALPVAMPVVRAAASGYVPHRHLEVHNAPSVVE